MCINKTDQGEDSWDAQTYGNIELTLMLATANEKNLPPFQHVGRESTAQCILITNHSEQCKSDSLWKHSMDLSTFYTM